MVPCVAVVGSTREALPKKQRAMERERSFAGAGRVAATRQRRHACFYSQDKNVAASAVGSDPEMRHHALHILQIVRAFLLPRFW